MVGHAYSSFQRHSIIPYISGSALNGGNERFIIQYFEVKDLFKKHNKKTEDDIEWQSKPIKELKVNQDKVQEFINKYKLDPNTTAEQLMSNIYKIDINKSFDQWRKGISQMFQTSNFQGKAPYGFISGIEKPYRGKSPSTDYTDKIKFAEENGMDGLVMLDNNDAFNSDVVVTFDKSKVHVLGSKKDVQGFQDFVKNENKTRSYSYNPHLKVKEYLAEAFTKVILDGYKFDEDQKQNLKSLLNNLDQNIKNKDEILFFNFISDQQFDSNDIQDRDIVNAIKYSKGVDSEKVQDALKKVYDRFDRNKLEYKGKADKTFVKYDSAFGEMRDLKDNSLSVLETHDIVYVKSEDDKYYDKYYPVIYTYFDDKADVQKFVTSVKKKDGTYTIQTFPANQIIGFRKSYGNVKFREVEDYELDEIDELFKEQLVFTKSTSKEDIEGIDGGKLITINIGKGKSKINKKAIEIQIGDNLKSNQDLLRSIKKGSIVSYKIKGDNKVSTIHAPVVRSMANGVELYSSNNKKVYFVPFSDIKSVILFKEDLISQSKKEYLYDDKALDDYYKNKKLRYSTFKFTDKTNKFKKVSNSMYDYNQVNENDGDIRQALDEAIKKKYEEYNKTNKEDTFEKFLSENIGNTKNDRLIQVYLNRKKLINNITDDNVYVIYDNLGEDGNTYHNKGKVIYTSKDMIYVYTDHLNNETGEIKQFIQKINIRDNSPKPFKPVVRRFVYDNSKEYNITEAFYDHKDSIKQNYEQLNSIWKEENKGLRSVKVKQLQEAQESVFVGKSNIPTNLYDYFYYEYMTDFSDNKKAFYVSRAQVGDIVFYNEKGKDGKIYTKSSMIVGINPYGKVIVGDLIRNARGSKAYLNQSYIRKEIDFSDIQYMGYNIYDNKDLGISANKKMLAKYNALSKKIEEFNDVFAVDNKKKLTETVSKWKNANNLNVVDLYSVKNKNTNRLFYMKKSDIDNQKYIQDHISDYEISLKPVRYGIEVKYVSNGKTRTFLRRNKDKMYNIDPSLEAFNDLKVGDVMTIGKKSGNYYNMIVTDIIQGKNGNRLKIESFYIDENGVKKNITRIVDEYYLKSGDIHQFHIDKFNKKDNKEYSENKTYKKPEVKPVEDQINYPFSKQTSGYNKSYDNFVKVNEFAKRLEALYNVKFKMLTSEEIAAIYDKDGVIFSNSRAFVFKDEIILNSDMASLAEPLHELTHMILPIIKNDDPVLYNSIINHIISHPDFDNIAKSYQGLSNDLLNQEVFCTIFGEYYANKIRTEDGQNWNKNNKSWFSRIIDKLKNVFKSIFNINSKDFEDMHEAELMSNSLENIMDKFGGNILNGKYTNIVSVYNQSVNKKVKDLISKLMNEQKILKKCYE